jgi:hypothetical protein
MSVEHRNREVSSAYNCSSFAKLDMFLHIVLSQVNEAWFGVNAVTDCNFESGGDRGHRASALTPRPVVQAITALYGGPGGATPLTCAQMKSCWDCSLSTAEADISGGACNSACGLQLNSVMNNAPDGTVNTRSAATGAASVTPIVMLAALLAAIVALRA